ncbi:DNA primase family protein [Propionispora vibrioides]|uniref:Putative DNA primase/helicase n=1 Tax=Propionispora vibrioides TaxID=112903 RepID=A0A1H8U279_9FIRM|nr:phage/plasmid primase, P4 family [Propionispora vibrioides]SEO97261.1 putative DNA primase/helicase [Propionispora vibrioides]
MSSKSFLSKHLTTTRAKSLLASNMTDLLCKTSQTTNDYVTVPTESLPNNDIQPFSTPKQEASTANEAPKLNLSTSISTPTFKKSPSTPYQIAKLLVSEGNIFGVSDNNLYYYDRNFNYYKLLLGETAEINIRKAIPENLRTDVNTYKIMEIIKCLKSYTGELSTAIHPNSPSLEGYINFRNGILDLSNKSRLDSHPRFHFTNYIDCNYPFYEEVQGYTFNRFLFNLSNNDSEILHLLQEVLGLMISEIRSLKKSFFFFGPPHTGKSLLLNVMRKIVGEEFCSNLSIHDLNDRFRLGAIYGKKLNICAEISEESLKNLSQIKILTGNDSSVAELKYQNAFSFQNRALLVFAGNNLPNLKAPDITNAFFDRIIIIPFLNSVPQNQQDYHLETKLLLEKEYIVEFAVNGLQRLIKNRNALSDCTLSTRLKTLYIKEQNSFHAFIADCCEITPNSFTMTNEIECAYINYCQSNRLQSISSQDWHKLLKGHYNLDSQRKRLLDENKRGYIGIRIKTPE